MNLPDAIAACRDPVSLGGGNSTVDSGALRAVLIAAESTIRAVPPLRSGADPVGQECGKGDGHKLLPCPFCSGPAKYNHDAPHPFHYVWCGKCGIRTPAHSTKDSAIAAWNRRTPTVIDGEKLREAARAARQYVSIGTGTPAWNENVTLLAAFAESTLTEPVCKTKDAVCWRVWHSVEGKPRCRTTDTREEADAWVQEYTHHPDVACIRVTGPHLQTVPA